jgi:type IV secretion system protein VirB6
MGDNILSLIDGLSQVQFLINLVGALEVAQAAMSSYAAHVAGEIDLLARLCLTIFVVLYGIALMFGHVREVQYDAFVRLFKIAVVCFIARNAGVYNTEIALFFWHMPESLINWLSPASVRTMLQTFIPGPATTGTDVSILLISTVMSFTVSLMHSSLSASSLAGQTDLALFASGLGIGVAGASLTAVVAGILLVAKMSLAVLLALGPFFLVAILFEKTKSYFEGWLSQVLNFVLVILLLTLTIQLLFPILIITVASYYAVAQLVGVLSLRESVELITLIIIFLAVIKQVPTTAAAVVRGYAVGSLQERGLMGSSGNNAGGKSASQAHAEMNARR